MKHILTLAALVFATTCFGQVPDYVPTDGLVAWYPLNGNGSGSIFASGDAVIVGAQPTTDRFANPEGAMMFDGNDNLSIPSSAWNVVSPQFSFSLWFKINTPGSISTYIVEKGSTNGGWEYALSFEPNGEARFIIHEPDGSGKYLVFQGGQIGEGWNHVGFSFDMDGTSFIALNDDIISQPNAPNGTSPLPGTSTLNLGARRGWANHPDPYGGFNGALDDFAFWNRALTSSEMQAMYDIQTGCVDTSACNYNPLVFIDDGSCHFHCQYCKEGTVWAEAIQGCIVANPSDTDFDGCVSMTDLLDLLSVFGTCNEIPWSCGDPLEYQGYDYETVQIGEQCWFAENLRADQFRNGDVIPSGLSDGQWTLAEGPAMAWYGEGSASCENFVPEFDACNGIPSNYNFGGLYNGYVVTDARPVCPSGWSTPSMSDFYTLLDNYEDAYQAADALKAQSTWSSEGNGSNASGFRGFASGFRRGLGTAISESGFYDRAGVYGNFWSDDFVNEESFLVSAISLTPQLGVEVLDDSQWPPPPGGFGFSVRCIQDSE